ncbi:MAG TPA: serine/threonine-protein kinase [Bryobacteraceae bacterium]|jgi:serine/threonine-protein kinase
MDRCVTCNSELADTSKACPTCGSAAALATVAMELPPPAPNGAKSAHAPPASPKPPSRTSLSRLSETSIPDDGRFLPGTLVNGRYRIVGLLGRGGMGEVYRATDLTLAQPVALKFLPEAGVTERVLERFHAEVRIARQVSHPNICRVYDIGEVDGQPFISMEYVDGEDLAGLLQRIGRLPADKALETSRKICAGLAAAHDKGVIHRDLKPQNIMLNKRGEPVIMDFGLAAVASQLTGAEARNGTPAYMAPEQLRGEEVTAKSDIYSLGLVLYEIFSGKRAYEAKTLADLLKLQESAQAPSLTSLAADVDPQVEKVVKRCLNPDPAQRPATPLAVAAALPGGDPLAAALAAGETPSPEMVAASGKTEGMDLRYSIPLLVFTIAAVIGLPFFAASHDVLQKAPFSYPPVVAEHEARKIAASFGYTQLPDDSSIDYTDGSPIRDYWKTHDRQGKSWSDLIAAESFYTYYYRESPASLVAKPYGWISPDNPAPITAGMIDMRLNFAGRLREFEEIPAEKPASAAPNSPFDEPALFRAIGYNEADFTETPSLRVPMVAYDLRKAWKGPATGLPGIEVHVEAASLAGKLTAVKVVYPWTPARRDPPRRSGPADLIGAFGIFAMTAFAVIFGLVFAVRNLRKNRADRKGAFRLAFVAGLLNFLNWVGTIHHIADLEEWNFFLNALGDSIFTGFTMWVLYLAIEPAVRARWPRALVTWNRLLAGQFGDAQLGASILIGAVIGLGLRIVLELVDWIDYVRDGVPPFNSLRGSGSSLIWFGANAQTMQGALSTGFIVFFTIFGFRNLLKNDYLAALGTAAFFAAIQGQGIWNRPDPWLEGTLLAVIFFILALMLLRMGMLATIVTIFFINTVERINISPSLSSWYTSYGLATMALLIGIAVYAFWRSMGSRTIGDSD